MAATYEIDAMIAFFSRMRLVYDKKGIPEVAQECDDAIALIQRILLDPRLDRDPAGVN